MRSRAAWMARRRALDVPWRNPVKAKVGRGDVPGWSVRMERQKASTRFLSRQSRRRAAPRQQGRSRQRGTRWLSMHRTRISDEHP